MRPWALCSIVLLVACSSTARIATAAHDIRQAASSSRDRFGRIHTEIQNPQPNLPDIATEAELGRDEQDAIISMVDDIYQGLTGVRDEVPWWGRLLSWLLVVLAIGGLCAALWYVGAAGFLGRLIARVAAWLAKLRAPTAP